MTPTREERDLRNAAGLLKVHLDDAAIAQRPLMVRAYGAAIRLIEREMSSLELSNRLAEARTGYAATAMAGLGAGRYARTEMGEMR